MRNTSVVQVSDAHLRQGVPGSESWCALAWSLRDELHADLNDEIEVTAKYVHVALGHGEWWAETTPELQRFMRQFDATEDEEAEGAKDPAKLAKLTARATAGLLAFPLTWHEGEPPEDDGDA